jgi:hypothetical protein
MPSTELGGVLSQVMSGLIISLVQAEYPKSIMDKIARSYVGSEAKYPLDATETVLPVSPSPPPELFNGSEYPEDHGEKLSVLLEQNCTLMRRNIMVRCTTSYLKLVCPASCNAKDPLKPL